MTAAHDEATTPIYEVHGPRATIRLNRPRHHNRLEPEDLTALMALFDRIEAAPSLRVLVPTGTGRSFSSGYDLGSISKRRALR